MFKKKDLAIAVAMALSVSPVGLAQTSEVVRILQHQLTLPHQADASSACNSSWDYCWEFHAYMPSRR